MYLLINNCSRIFTSFFFVNLAEFFVTTRVFHIYGKKYCNNNMEENPVLKANETFFESLFKSGEILSKFINGMVKEDENTDYFSLLNRDIKFVIKQFIFYLPTEKVKKILKSINLPKSKICLDEIEKTWKNFLYNCKKIIKTKLLNLPKFPFWPKSVMEVNLKNILTPIKIRFIQDDDLTIGNFLFDETELLPQLKIGQRVLIYGDPGIGKSYHCLNILQQWVDDRLCNDTLILYVKLMDVTNGESLIDTIIRQNATSNRTIDKSLLKYYLKNDEHKILLILDGADEFLIPDSYIQDIINEKGHIIHPIIVLTRQFKVKDIIKSYDIRMEVLGFDNPQKLQFFQNFFQESNSIQSREDDDDDIDDFENNDDIRNTDEKKSRKLYKYLNKERPLILESCRNPLFATITAAVWDNSSSLIINDCMIIEEAIKILFEKSKLKKNSYSEDTIYKEIGEKCLKFILNNERMIVNDVVESLRDFGGLIVFKPTGFKGENKEFNFIHFSFHEFFTAKYLISKLENNDNIDANKSLLNEICESDKILYFKKVLEFIKQMKMEIYQTIISENNQVIHLLEDVDESVIEIFKNKTSHSVKLLNVRISNTIMDLIFKNFIHHLKEIMFMNVMFDFDFFIKKTSNASDNQVTLLNIHYLDEHQLTIYNMIHKICNVFKKLEKLSLKNLIFEETNEYPDELIEYTLKSLTLNQCKFENFFHLNFYSEFSDIVEVDFSKTEFPG